MTVSRALTIASAITLALIFWMASKNYEAAYMSKPVLHRTFVLAGRVVPDYEADFHFIHGFKCVNCVAELPPPDADQGEVVVVVVSRTVRTINGQYTDLKTFTSGLPTIIETGREVTP